MSTAEPRGAPRPSGQIGFLAPDQSDLDDYLLSSANTTHSQVTEELASWLIDRLPD
ncbi:hypothetical protein [Kitasatospora sp. McL0602]|uniref:hypothetical protein n=1 Tax=Kitasatospora sp. McL0602 TaxID=3439530 RepID=UPI003F89062C